MAKKQKNNIEVGVEKRRFTRWLQVKLTQDELLQRAQTLSQQLKELGEVEAEKARVAREFGEKIKDLAGETSRLAAIVRNGEEGRNVECEEVKNFSTRRVRIARIDTDEVIEERDMYSEERQKSLDLPAEEKSEEAVAQADDNF